MTQEAIKPGTPLPWSLKEDKTTVLGHDPEDPDVPWEVADVGLMAGYPDGDDEANAAYIVHCANTYPTMQATIDELRSAIIRHIPIDYLQRHDAEGAIGPTSALNIEAALRDYAEDRWKLIDRLKEQKATIDELVDVLSAVTAFIEALADNDPDEPIADNGMTILGKLQFDAPSLAMRTRALIAKHKGAGQ